MAKDMTTQELAELVAKSFTEQQTTLNRHFDKLGLELRQHAQAVVSMQSQLGTIAETLEKHTEILDNHTEILDNHTHVLERLDQERLLHWSMLNVEKKKLSG